MRRNLQLELVWIDFQLSLSIASITQHSNISQFTMINTVNLTAMIREMCNKERRAVSDFVAWSHMGFPTQFIKPARRMRLGTLLLRTYRAKPRKRAPFSRVALAYLIGVLILHIYSLSRNFSLVIYACLPSSADETPAWLARINCNNISTLSTFAALRSNTSTHFSQTH